MSDTQEQVATSTTTQIQPPSLYDVIFFNDQKTHYEFVVLILMHLFGKSYEQATEITDYIHANGKATVGTYVHEIASTKRDEAIQTARNNGHPLKVEIEPSSIQADLS